MGTGTQYGWRACPHFPTGDSTYTANRKAIVNGEGVYDHGRAVSQSQFNRFRARQSGYWSFLSGSIGYTFGAAGIWEWGLCGEPNESLRWSACDQYFGGRSEVNYRSYSQAMSQASSIDMQHFSYLHKTIWDHSAADYLDVFEHWRIANQPQNDQHRKMVVARSSDWFFAYLPENEQVRVNVLGLTGNPGASLWFNPRVGVFAPLSQWSCGPDPTCTFQNPFFQASDPQDRDGMLVAPATTLYPSFGELITIEDPGIREGSVGSQDFPQVYAFAGRFSEQETWGVEVLILGAEAVAQDTWFRVSDGLGGLPEKASGAGTESGFVFVWLNDTDGDGYREVWARRLGSTGKPAGSEFLVSDVEGVDHRTVAVAVADDGSARVVWTAESHGGEPTTIWMQSLDSEGRFSGSSVEIGSPQGTARVNPKVAAGANGGCLVAWLEPGEDGFSPRVLAQAFDAEGLEQSSAQVLAAGQAPVVWLSGVRREGAGYGVIWENRAFGSGAGWYHQALDEEGERLGCPALLAASLLGGAQ